MGIRKKRAAAESGRADLQRFLLSKRRLDESTGVGQDMTTSGRIPETAWKEACYKIHNAKTALEQVHNDQLLTANFWYSPYELDSTAQCARILGERQLRAQNNCVEGRASGGQ